MEDTRQGKMDTRKGKIGTVLEKHAHVRSLLYSLGRYGNETGGVSTIASSARSFDLKRINKERQTSPSKCEDLSDPGLEQSLEEELIELSKEKEKELHDFQDFVTNLIRRAETVSGGNEGCKLIENTVRAIVSSGFQFYTIRTTGCQVFGKRGPLTDSLCNNLWYSWHLEK